MSVVTAILTICLSGVVAALVSFLLATKRDQFLSRQKKLEELFMAADDYDNMLRASLITFLPALADGASIHSVSEVVDKIKTRDAASKARLRMLAYFYFPNVIPAIEAHEAARAAVVAELIRYDKGEGSVHQYDAALEKLHPAGEALRTAIIAEGQKYSDYRFR